MQNHILLSVFGLISGVLSGMGMGGGTLLIPLITLFSGIEQRQAQLYNLTAFIPTAISSLIVHSKNGLVEKRGLLSIVIPAALTSVIAGLTASYSDGELLKRLFGGFLLLVAAWTVFGDKKSAVPDKRKSFVKRRKKLNKHTRNDTTYVQFAQMQKRAKSIQNSTK